ncbi:hypothetical protein STH119 [Symbiobacterium thermophilum IAM 14863]|uniref:Glycosyltransferase 2-like domain-containing protein n=1 Tax=Symbiobacterium thermophilum (strain DSM 24528 / JCM 14929 / IAM 14863 / T) TaxID=292459 RepID=Q67T89_SYMTH|nr:hypothetical protein STH119 [Symbiobacterium thermophilum IAM 14863]
MSAVARAAELIGRLRPSGDPADEPAACVVLVRDQADRIEGALDRIARAADGELVLVDLGSRDETAAILNRLACRYGHALVLQLGHLTRQEAIARAVAATTAPRVVIVDLEGHLEKEG